MNTNKTAYWIAVGVLALGLSSEYQHGRLVTLHRIAERADLVLCRISTHAEQALADARLLTTQDGSTIANLMASADAAEMAWDKSELVREQAREKIELLRDRVQDVVRNRVRDDDVGEGIREQIRAQADVIRAQAEMRRAEIDQIRLQTRSQVRLAHMANRRVMVVCPKTGARIVVNAGLHSVDVSADEDEDSF
ncbi:MAG: hypothetical protein WBD25_17100 [Terriglobales bacterium]|jgi:hypothetical protein